jgi:menaquinone-dependent protoporphyrinogen oxidase
MRVVVTCGSKRGGTEGIGRMLADALQQEGHRVDLLPPDKAARATGFDAVIVGEALYANRWHPAARRFVSRREKALRLVPVWFFSSGPLRQPRTAFKPLNPCDSNQRTSSSRIKLK